MDNILDEILTFKKTEKDEKDEKGEKELENNKEKENRSFLDPLFSKEEMQPLLDKLNNDKDNQLFTLKVEITMTAENAFYTNICKETILPVAQALSKYADLLDDEDSKRKYNYYAVDLIKYGNEENKTYDHHKCVPILRKLKELVIPTKTIQF